MLSDPTPPKFLPNQPREKLFQNLQGGAGGQGNKVTISGFYKSCEALLVEESFFTREAPQASQQTPPVNIKRQRVPREVRSGAATSVRFCGVAAVGWEEPNPWLMLEDCDGH